jgi:acetoacetyl-CoA synthetase
LEPGEKPELLWRPSADEIGRANITRFTRRVEQQRGLRFADYDELRRWSISEPSSFWASVWSYFELGPDVADHEVISGTSMPDVTWFPGVETNFAGAVLRSAADDVDVAVITLGEESEPEVLSWGELRRQVAAAATFLRGLGVGPGDRVVGYLPNIGAAAVAFLATAALGATWASVGQDYAAPAAADRLAQLEPKVLVAADGYRFGGQAYDRIGEVRELQRLLPTLTDTILIPRLAAGEWPLVGHAWSTCIAGDAPFDAAQVPFSHELWVMFTSGATGRPKGLVHSHGGVLIETFKTIALHWDFRPGDRLFWFTSPSWVMWNLSVATLLTGASAICYDGSATYPHTGRLWDVVADLGATLFGTSPGYLKTCRDAGIEPAGSRDLHALRAISTTGSPLSANLHQWVSEALNSPLPVWSISGGTDVVGAFCGGVPTVPVWAGQLSVRCLGVDMQAWDDAGKPLIDAVGELVVTSPMPSMPVRFLNDPSGERYRQAYLDKYPGVWCHGDWTTITSYGSVVVHGRSDATLNRNGIRLGSADIYSALEGLDEIIDCLVVGVELPNDSYWMPLFVTLRAGITLDSELTARIRAAIREQASSRHVPDEVLQVSELPRTRTGKRLEVPVKRILQGANVEDASAGAYKPELLEFFVGLARQRGSAR